mmetsp:Transcript_15444/g.43434  ORF Transcript_15444/g.43434 Transcript_15444/m.43434 type:complete len:210 (-) Transcript_15444:135-764(-)
MLSGIHWHCWLIYLLSQKGIRCYCCCFSLLFMVSLSSVVYCWVHMELAEIPHDAIIVGSDRRRLGHDVLHLGPFRRHLVLHAQKVLGGPSGRVREDGGDHEVIPERGPVVPVVEQRDGAVRAELHRVADARHRDGVGVGPLHEAAVAAEDALERVLRELEERLAGVDDRVSRLAGVREEERHSLVGGRHARRSCSRRCCCCCCCCWRRH